MQNPLFYRLRLAVVVWLALLITIFSTSPSAYAVLPLPVLPHIVWGHLTLDGNAPSIGTKITILVNDVAVGSTATIGIDGLWLAVNLTSADGTSGDIISFEVTDYVINDTTVLTFGVNEEIDLQATLAVPTETATPNPTATPVVVPTETATPNPTATPAVVPTETATPNPTATPVVVPTETATPNPTATPIVVPTETATPNPTATPVVVPTETATPNPTATPVVVPTETAMPNPTATPVVMPTETATPNPTATPVVVPTETATPNPTATPVVMPTETATPDPTATPVIVPTETATPNPTATPVVVPTETATPNPTATPVVVPTETATPNPTATPVVVPTETATPNPTATPVVVTTEPATPSPTATPVIVATATPSPTSTPDSNDLDRDGVPADTEMGVPNWEGPNLGDGNGDGILDVEQSNVASIPSAANGEYITLVVPKKFRLENVSTDSSPDSDPPTSRLPWSQVKFQIVGLSPGEHVEVELIFHNGASPLSYWKFGPSPTDSQNYRWYEFDFDGSTGAVQKDNRTLLLHFVDGGRGDGDQSADGAIVDQGGAISQAWRVFVPQLLKK
ncbi:MAG: choice-of-anchor U domain-containing protein [Caldilineaceae bacterium]